MLNDPVAQGANPTSVEIATMSTIGRKGLAFELAANSPAYLPAFTRPEAGCNWVGVAGQVLDGQSKPVDRVAVVVRGRFNGKDVHQTGYSGASPAYGPGGFEVQIGSQAAQSQGELAIQLFDEQGEALSGVFPVITYNDCQKNLILLKFQSGQVSRDASGNNVFVPSVVK